MLRSRSWAWAVVAMSALGGCYQYVPVDTSASPPVGSRYAFQISDQGRVALADRLGAGVLRIEGTLTESQPEEFILNVWRVDQFGGQPTTWTGESVRLRRDYVGFVQKRQLAYARTFLVTGAATAGVVGIVFSQGLFGFSDTTEPGRPPDPPPTSSRAWPD